MTSLCASLFKNEPLVLLLLPHRIIKREHELRWLVSKLV